MNIIIPMSGEGTRFPRDKYHVPKPLIQINGKAMIQHAIESLDLDGKYHFVIRQDSFYFQIFELLKIIVPDCKIITVDETTSGPACSALLFENEINNNKELVIANCDQIMWWDSGLFLQTARYYKYDGIIVTYETDTPKNSFCKIDKNGLVLEVKEKEVISNISLNGIHYWRKGLYFLESARAMIESRDTAPNGEYYIGPTYNYMINKFNHKVGIHHIPNWQHNPVGVPEDLQTFIEKI
jgi:NDP-sugar pyrophosphorylase family protein